MRRRKLPGPKVLDSWALKRLAYADCFAAALARSKNAELYTGDPEFKAVEKEVKVVWL